MNFTIEDRNQALAIIGRNDLASDTLAAWFLDTSGGDIHPDDDPETVAKRLHEAIPKVPAWLWRKGFEAWANQGPFRCTLGDMILAQGYLKNLVSPSTPSCTQLLAAIEGGISWHDALKDPELARGVIKEVSARLKTSRTPLCKRFLLDIITHLSKRVPPLPCVVV